MVLYNGITIYDLDYVTFDFTIAFRESSTTLECAKHHIITHGSSPHVYAKKFGRPVVF